ncbi:P-II family nitrogen regulator [Methanobacterium sp. ACI-7]|uniref:P-II family nitrogen regulator n=1 Tax=unclassified Methanobacterium TaxID=2627676 RepID=UPI0039C2E36F
MEKRMIQILGTSGSGKKTSLRQLTDENMDIKLFNYTKAIIGGNITYLLSSKDYEGFIAIEELLKSNIDGIIIIIDNQKGITETDLEIVNLIDKKHIPYIIFANKQDLCDSIVDISLDVLIIPTIATEGVGINDGFKMLLKLIESQSIGERSMKDITEDIKRSKNENISPKPDISELVNKLKSSKNNTNICKVKIFLHPIELDNVKDILIDAGFSNLTIIEIGYVEPSKNKENYRGSMYAVNIPPRVEIDIVVKYDDVKYIIEALKTIKSDDIYDDVFISPVEDVIRIRTKEHGIDAVE